MDKLKNIRLIMADMDGTLLDDSKNMDTDIYEVIEALDKQGIMFTFGSGRNVHIMKEYVDKINLTTPYITNNGANMFIENNCIYELNIETKELLHALAYLEKVNLPYIAYSNEEVFITHNDDQLQMFLKRLIGKIPIVTIKNAQELKDAFIFKVVVIQEDKDGMKEVVDTINQDSKYTHMMCSEGNIYTLTNMEATKGKTLQRLMKEMKIQKDEVLVFGDNFNDISMFEVAEYSVAMENASEDVKNKAKYKTLSNNEHGVSSFIKNYIL